MSPTVVVSNAVATSSPAVVSITINAASSAAGTLDSTFNGGAGSFTKANTAGGTSDPTNDQGNAITVDGNGNIIVAGSSVESSSGKSYMAVWRLTSVGIIDTSFNSTGHYFVTGTDGGTSDAANAVTIDGSGNIVVAGSSVDSGGKSYMAVWRLTNAGILDTTFNKTGYFTYTGTAGGSSDAANAVTIDGSGNIVVADQFERLRQFLYGSMAINHRAHLTLLLTPQVT